MVSIATIPDSARQERVLAVALEVFGRYGFRKASMDEIARSADISRQGLYLHFANKEALFRAAVRQELETALGDVSRCLNEEGVGLERRAVAACDARLAAAIAAAMSENDRRRSGVTPEEIAGALHTVAQGAKYLSNARKESREEFVARMTAAVRVVFAGFGTTAKRTP